MGYQSVHRPNPWAAKQSISIAIGALCAFVLVAGSNMQACAASLSRSADIAAPASAVWSAIGPFCAIRDWHPAIGTCVADNGNPPTRTLVTKDGKTTFVEPETARSETDRFYSYTFKASPFPVTHYMGTIWVVPTGARTSTVLWTGTYTPLPGKEKDANDAFAGVYEAGLAAVKAKFSH